MSRTGRSEPGQGDGQEGDGQEGDREQGDREQGEPASEPEPGDLTLAVAAERLGAFPELTQYWAQRLEPALSSKRRRGWISAADLAVLTAAQRLTTARGWTLDEVTAMAESDGRDGVLQAAEADGAKAGGVLAEGAQADGAQKQGAPQAAPSADAAPSGSGGLSEPAAASLRTALDALHRARASLSQSAAS